MYVSALSCVCVTRLYERDHSSQIYTCEPESNEPKFLPYTAYSEGLIRIIVMKVIRANKLFKHDFSKSDFILLEYKKIDDKRVWKNYK